MLKPTNDEVRRYLTLSFVGFNMEVVTNEYGMFNNWRCTSQFENTNSFAVREIYQKLTGKT